MRRPDDVTGLLPFVISCLLAIWLLYLAYKVAQHVQAWPF